MQGLHGRRHGIGMRMQVAPNEHKHGIHMAPHGRFVSTITILTVSNLQVLKLAANGRMRHVFLRRRDLLREYRLQPRDLRRIDPRYVHLMHRVL